MFVIRVLDSQSRYTLYIVGPFSSEKEALEYRRQKKLTGSPIEKLREP